MKAIVVLTTCDQEEQTRTLAQTLVQEGLAACVHILPAGHSVYLWQGVMEEAKEWTLVIKTREELYQRLEERIRQLHTYEVPEILALPVVRGLPSYLSWLFANTDGIQ